MGDAFMNCVAHYSYGSPKAACMSAGSIRPAGPRRAQVTWDAIYVRLNSFQRRSFTSVCILGDNWPHSRLIKAVVVVIKRCN